ncbi:hypothetical protein UFOVP276_26 [uncultured Caudovirales phage]|uniref:Uncharacterized protein n=1 Tax=uncultured Caudovirales phage TaxID=2100421 RepID=A0A6J5LKZ0_9CAUD|nr:hypothetical protein UFOVP127_163 [uncultured Caudovirales phage]CAB4134885.1 hypothetical protein UFOVP276_26 [uncultured Caudovirales phage]
MRVAQIKSRKLREVIKGFAALYPKYADAYYAQGSCYMSSEDFITYAKMKKLSMEMKLFRVDKKPPYAKYKDQHWVVLVDGCIAIDFTARQFHRSFAFPRVWIDKKPKKAYPFGKTVQYA